MARRCATSRWFTDIYPVFLCLWLYVPCPAETGLYTASDQILLLSRENVDSVLVNSTAAMVVEFYASWCGHCVAFSPFYKKLARDTKEWKPAVNIAAIDCAPEENREVCRDFRITGYPTIKFFHAYSEAGSLGVAYPANIRDVPDLRHKTIDSLEGNKDPWPPACPPLEPISQAEVDVFFETNSALHLALIFENANSYIGREVTLDLLQFENIAVRRVLDSETSLVTKLGVTDFPSCYLYYPGGNFTRLRVNNEARMFYTYALQGLRGVVRSGKATVVLTEIQSNSTKEPWRQFNNSHVYMADLESALHYSLRVELAAHDIIRGDALNALKKYISVLAKYFPGRPVVVNLLKTLKAWLQDQTENKISYKAFEDVLDNRVQVPHTALPEGVRWVGCQGSQPHFRRYPCGVWTLFHVLSVQANSTGGSDPVEVLSAMRSYIHHFFGCRACAEHFENMAQEGLEQVGTLPSAVLWLWFRHNQVNNRISGDLSEDPFFPKIQWPSPETCPACHTVNEKREHKWSKDEVLSFLLSHYSSSNILTDYLEDENKILEKQNEKHRLQNLAYQKHLERKAREAPNAVTPSPPTPTQEEEEEEEGPQDETEAYGEEEVEDEEEGGEGAPAAPAIEEEGKTDPTPWKVGRGRRQAYRPSKVPGMKFRERRYDHRFPSIIGMKFREKADDIVDLDSFVNQNFKDKALQLAALSRVKQRTLQTKVELDHKPVFGLGMELDTALGMIGLQPVDTDLEPSQRGQRLQKRELSGQYFGGEVKLSHKGRWMSSLSIGFSNLDISLCIFLYFLSSMCLLAMYVFFKNRLRRRRAKPKTVNFT
nr:sulfhydryl oxidase 1 [Nothobranchius furzeri]